MMYSACKQTQQQCAASKGVSSHSDSGVGCQRYQLPRPGLLVCIGLVGWNAWSVHDNARHATCAHIHLFLL
jgi:hypothetical protein